MIALYTLFMVVCAEIILSLIATKILIRIGRKSFQRFVRLYDEYWRLRLRIVPFGLPDFDYDKTNFIMATSVALELKLLPFKEHIKKAKDEKAEEKDAEQKS